MSIFRLDPRSFPFLTKFLPQVRDPVAIKAVKIGFYVLGTAPMLAMTGVALAADGIFNAVKTHINSGDTKMVKAGKTAAGALSGRYLINASQAFYKGFQQGLANGRPTLEISLDSDSPVGNWVQQGVQTFVNESLASDSPVQSLLLDSSPAPSFHSVTPSIQSTVTSLLEETSSQTGASCLPTAPDILEQTVADGFTSVFENTSNQNGATCLSTAADFFQQTAADTVSHLLDDPSLAHGNGTCPLPTTTDFVRQTVTNGFSSLLADPSRQNANGTSCLSTATNFVRQTVTDGVSSLFNHPTLQNEPGTVCPNPYLSTPPAPFQDTPPLFDSTPYQNGNGTFCPTTLVQTGISTLFDSPSAQNANGTSCTAPLTNFVQESISTLFASPAVQNADGTSCPAPDSFIQSGISTLLNTTSAQNTNGGFCAAPEISTPFDNPFQNLSGNTCPNPFSVVGDAVQQLASSEESSGMNGYLPWVVTAATVGAFGLALYVGARRQPPKVEEAEDEEEVVHQVKPAPLPQTPALQAPAPAFVFDPQTVFDVIPFLYRLKKEERFRVHCGGTDHEVTGEYLESAFQLISQVASAHQKGTEFPNLLLKRQNQPDLAIVAEELDVLCKQMIGILSNRQAETFTPASNGVPEDELKETDTEFVHSDGRRVLKRQAGASSRKRKPRPAKMETPKAAPLFVEPDPISIGWDDDFDWGQEIMSALSPTEMSSPNAPTVIQATAQSLLEVFTTWFVDSKAPEKAQKYVLGLNSSLKTLKESGYDPYVWLKAALKEKLGQSPEQLFQQQKKDWINSGSMLGSFIQVFLKSPNPGFYLSAFFALRALKSADDYPNVRLQYGDFLRHLRNALSSTEYLTQKGELQRELVELMEGFCYSKYTATYLFNYWEAFLEKLGCDIEEDGLTYEKLGQLLDENNEKLHDTDPELRKPTAMLRLEQLAGTVGASFDSGGTWNIPKVRSEQVVTNGKNTWTITRLAHGTPTIEGNIIQKGISAIKGQNNASISPEFLGFLRALKEKKQRIFYSNLQQITGLEGDRSRAIYDIQRDPEFAGTFFSMSVPMDGHYFEQLIKNVQTQPQFKKNLIGLFFDEQNKIVRHSSAQLPLDLIHRIDADPRLGIIVADELRRIFDGVHENYFFNEAIKTPEQRQDFIMQFYSEITDYFISMDYLLQDKMLKDPANAALEDHELIKFVVESCKDNMDRGGAKNGIAESRYNLVSAKTEKEAQEERRNTYTATLGGGYAIKFKEVIQKRLTYYSSLMRRVYSRVEKTPGQIDKIRRGQPAYFTVQSHKSIRDKDTAPVSAVPTLETALTRKDCVEAIRGTPVASAPLNNFNTEMSLPYKKAGGIPDLKKLFDQLKRDLPRLEVWVDGQLYKEPTPLFEALLKIKPDQLNTDLPRAKWAMFNFLCKLQQGSAKDIFTFATEKLTPQYADLKVLQKKTSAIQEAFMELRTRCTGADGKTYLQKFIQSLPFGSEGEKALLPDHEWEQVQADQLDAQDPVMAQFSNLCQTPAGRTEVLEMLYRAAEKRHLPLAPGEIFLETYKPVNQPEIYQTRIFANSLNQSISVQQDLDLVDSQGQQYLRILGSVEADKDSATVSYKIL
ncbi:MAG: hypothetical protein JSS32_08815 [Verrucomicrobia bacterium]|nr:hypothetical protein [Verrucomicrobiota bacterium]